MCAGSGGLTGCGKTQIALEFAYRFRDEYQEIIWLRADSYKNLIQDILSVLEKIYHKKLSAQDLPQAIELAERWLNQEQKRLLVLDGVKDLSLFKLFHPDAYTGHILMTCNTRVTDRACSFIHLVSVEDMDFEEGALMLLRYIESGGASQCSLKDFSTEQIAQAKLIVQEHWGLPLGIAQAGAYIKETACSLREYLLCYQQHRHDLLHFHGQAMADPAPSVATAILRQAAVIERENPLAITFIRLCATLTHYALPEELVINTIPLLDPTVQTTKHSLLAFHAMLKSLIFVYFLRRDLKTRALYLHPLVLDVLRAQMSVQQCHHYTELAARLVQHLPLLDRSGRYKGAAVKI
ncbi:NB-ARC domain-containing protein [Ktedonosporobacter rubrisoli]|uniref:NB-ARC domain-containing protein n=1 Tax=Ktedonosporobacter rubrisoli TaxID=2509675 RepID=UPI0013EE605D|nr:NB-ARC domain-containing protein [Ktedonosporobacter rubrisoli]